MAPGTRLPTVRELAGKVGLAVNAVARAYRELESAGSSKPAAASALWFLGWIRPTGDDNSAAHTFVSTARALGIDKAAALEYIEAAFG